MPASEPAVAANPDSNNPRIGSSESAQAVSSRQSIRAQLDVSARALLGAGWLGFIILLWLPLLLAAAGIGLLLVWIAASYALLQCGGFTAPDGKFLKGLVLGAAYAIAVGIGMTLRALSRPKDQRERLIGPGGRVLRVILGRQPPPLARHAEWFPDAPVLFVGAAFVVVSQALIFRRPSAGSLTISLILACLFYISLTWAAWWLWQGGRLGWAMYRFARRTEYRAGLLSGLFLVGSLAAGGLWWSAFDSELAEFVAQPEFETLHDAVAEAAPNTVVRRLLFGTAEVLWSEPATKQGVWRLVGPLVDRTAHENPDELVWISMDGLPRLAQFGGFVSADEAAAPAFTLCVNKLFPGEVSRVKKLPSFTSFRLDDDAEHDVLLGAVLQICENHAFRRPYENLGHVLERAAVNGAIDIKRRGKRVVVSDPEEGYFDRCPSPYDAPDRRIAAEQELARVKWSELKPLQKAVILEKAVLELDDEEIAANHNMSRDRAKNTYQNSIKKIRTKLLAACP